MFVAKTVIDSETTDFKAFERREDAKNWFLSARRQVEDQAVEFAALFHVPDCSDARKAVEAAKYGVEGVIILAQAPVKLEYLL